LGGEGNGQGTTEEGGGIFVESLKNPPGGTCPNENAKKTSQHLTKRGGLLGEDDFVHLQKSLAGKKNGNSEER